MYSETNILTHLKQEQPISPVYTPANYPEVVNMTNQHRKCEEGQHLPGINDMIRGMPPTVPDVPQRLSTALIYSGFMSQRGSTSPYLAPGELNPTMENQHNALRRLNQISEHIDKPQRKQRARSSPKREMTSKDLQRAEAKAKKETASREQLTRAIAKVGEAISGLMPHGRLPKSWVGKELKQNNAKKDLYYGKIPVLMSAIELLDLLKQHIEFLESRGFGEFVRDLKEGLANMEDPELMPKCSHPRL
ncbi:uncharacterized protein BDR25DRAFT_317334 [Lindgomyces ingoldianus]|uniref:Uncharacterized protein n=1 Tax=Lindgomyces ingoldianus TaxID=673940 RepID=A0ACB6QKL9_9PLEO|nr:uncharacterized protein BDR25DRAFT_317334 [Lindgomyces ingoldianus]KAF2467123.1 hypothetical protein BDR25DRAFT_317334 [Lindgomyces ingoldianus]